MFSQKKKKNKGAIIALVSVFFLLLGAFLLIPDSGLQKNEIVSGKSNTQIKKPPIQDEVVKPEKNNDSEKEESYYLVKNDNNIIKVYFCEKDNELVELESTDIIYETLSEQDQSTFDEGLIIKNRDELYKLLQDFES
ncbi:MAG: hypothetical protein PHH48_00820 [Eubacteriales bacterium]|nr:hypothetical protein [Eubacteriales bacterium]